ncbi:MAG: hypothetical protein RI963_3392, partial [Planctomycetota bacterium]
MERTEFGRKGLGGCLFGSAIGYNEGSGFSSFCPAAPSSFEVMLGMLFATRIRFPWLMSASMAILAAMPSAFAVDFNREIKPLLSNRCFICHGPDENERQGGTDGLRLDTREGATADQGGHAAIVPGKGAASELIRRITSDDPDSVMPPPTHGVKLTAAEVELLTRWIDEGADYAKHWSYTPPARPQLPQVKDGSWPQGAIDHFVLSRLEREGLVPQPQADPHALVRRLALDLTGLPPTPAEVDAFVAEFARDPATYERWVDTFMSRPTYGEHWAKMWLDLARYADSAGYADDPLRTIWLYRDYVIDSINANKPLDRFTIEQVAGDLLPDATDEQRVATAFHRNTLTNSEGGTDDEEFRNAAIVDRVNTTMAVWMGTTMACAQCHTHKYDPITQEEYFRVFAIMNQTEDADRRDESPLLSVYTPDQQQKRDALQQELASVREVLAKVTPELEAARDAWVTGFPQDIAWKVIKPVEVVSKAGSATKVEDSDRGPVVTIAGGPDKDTYEVKVPIEGGEEALRAIRIETLSDAALPGNGPGHAGGNFVISKLSATWTPADNAAIRGRYVRVAIPGKQKILSLAEVEIFAGANNIARGGEASQSSTGFDGPAALAIDGNTDGRYAVAKSTTHTEISDDPWWEVDLKSEQPIERMMLWNRIDEGTVERLVDFGVTILDEKRQVVWEQKVAQAPKPSVELSPGGPRSIRFAKALADYQQDGFA